MEELFRRNLNMLMAENGISQTDLAAKLGFPRQTLGNWIAGTARPSAYRAQKLADFFKVSVADLLYSDLDIPKAEKPATAGALILSEGSVDYSAKNTPPDALRRLLAYAVLLNDGDLDMVADMAERLAGKGGKR